MTTIEQLNHSYKTKTGYITVGIIEIVLFYILVSICIDTASMFAYFAAFVVLLSFLRNTYLLGQLIYKESRHKA